MSYLIGFILIALFSLLGNTITHLLHLPIPSSIISMLLLFLSLVFKIIDPIWVKKACLVLINIMPLFFIPASMGLIEHFDLLLSNSISLLSATLISSLIVLIIMAKSLERISGDKA